MSQFCGSGLSRRSNVTSAAGANAVPARSAQAAAANTLTVFGFILTSLIAWRQYMAQMGPIQRLGRGTERGLLRAPWRYEEIGTAWPGGVQGEHVRTTRGFCDSPFCGRPVGRARASGRGL